MKLVQTYNRKLAESVWWNLLWLTVGALLVTICIQSVATPHNFVAGGILGMAYLVWHWTGQLDLLMQKEHIPLKQSAYLRGKMD